jgi:hypothetical protein
MHLRLVGLMYDESGEYASYKVADCCGAGTALPGLTKPIVK